MDSLLANYASDGEEEEKKAPSPSSKPISVSLPKPSFNANQPRKTSIFSLPPPKIFSSSSSSSSIFSSIPPPKSHQPIPTNLTSSLSSDPTPKRVIQFKPPLNPSLLKTRHLDDDDDEEQEKERKPTKEAPSSTPKSLSSILPPPKNTLCLAPPRKSIIDSDVHAMNADGSTPEPEKDAYANHGNYEGNWVGTTPHVSSNANYSNYVNYDSNWVDRSSTSALETAENVPTNENYGNYANYGNYDGSWVDGSTAASEASGMIEGVGRVTGKRGRNEIPSDIIEVKQDELISNRPREDQVKLTGIAFGPSYQPVSSTKGKPTKLHKRKHQIGSLYFDMKQKEMELAERRAKGFLTKAETQAKYGW